MRRVREAVPAAECERRALAYLADHQAEPFIHASSVAAVIWPGARWIAAQGAGAAASRVLKRLCKQKLAKWHTDGSDAGYTITTNGFRQWRRSR